MADVAVLPTEAATTPDLLVLQASDRTGRVAQVSTLHRGSTWEDASVLDVDLGAIDLPSRWLVRLGTDRFALIATSSSDEHGSGSGVVVMLRVVRDGASWSLDAVARQTFDRAIESSGAADVDGFGSPELVLGMRPDFIPSESCGTTSIDVLDSAAAVRRVIGLPPTIGRGVIGRFDDAPGEDLLLYMSPGCPPAELGSSSLTAVNLADGHQSSIATAIPGDPWIFPTPLRFGAGRARDGAIAMTSDGLVAMANGAGAPIGLGGVGSVPLLAEPAGDVQAGGGPPGRIRVALLDATGSGSLVVGDLSRGASGLRWDHTTALAGSSFDAFRWQVIGVVIQAAAEVGDPSGAWSADAVTRGCPELVLPGAVLPCGMDALSPGSAWLATRPIAAMPVEEQAGVLVAAGLGWDGASGFPRSPTPSAAGPAGWWRNGASTPFALSELLASDVLRAPEAATTATIEPTTGKDGTTPLRGSGGTRLFTTIVPLTEGEDPPTPAGDVFAALAPRLGPAPIRRDEVIRLPAPAGLGHGTTTTAPVSLWSVRAADGSGGRWFVQVVPVDERGEWSEPTSQVVVQDLVAPTVELDGPFLSPVWPLAADLGGRTEPGSTVRVDGAAPIDVEKDGRFAFQRTLAPWPQTIRLEVTDARGNVGVAELSVIGGVDYRRLPWAGIGAAVLLAVVAIRGLVAGRREPGVTVGVTRRSMGAFDEPSGPEIEELPPGSGLARG